MHLLLKIEFPNVYISTSPPLIMSDSKNINPFNFRDCEGYFNKETGECTAHLIYSAKFPDKEEWLCYSCGLTCDKKDHDLYLEKQRRNALLPFTPASSEPVPLTRSHPHVESIRPLPPVRRAPPVPPAPSVQLAPSNPWPSHWS